MKVMLPADRIDYLKKEEKARRLMKLYLSKSENGHDELIAKLEEEINELNDEIEKLYEVVWSGKEYYK